MVSVMTLPQALRENRRLRQEIHLDRGVDVGIVSNIVLTDVDEFAATGLLQEGLDPSFSHAAFGQIAQGIETLAQQGVKHICVVLHVDALAENLPWTEASWSRDKVQEVLDFRLGEVRGALTNVTPENRVHLAVLAGGIDSHPTWNAVRRHALSHLEAEIQELRDRDTRVLWVDVQTGLEAIGFREAFSTARAARYSAPLTPLATGVIGEALAESIRRTERPPRKVLVLDADNTLWGGVLGEDGLANIALHPSVYPGNVYFRAQSVYRGIKERGALLAVVSKNEPSDLLAALNEHPYSQLRERDFVAVKSGWRPKVESIQELAAELSLGMDSFVFVDDSQVELAAVTEQLSLGAVVPVPEEPADYLTTLPAIAAEFDGSGNGLGDRTEKYRVRAAAAVLEKSAHSREEFLAGLSTRVVASVDASAQVPRVCELSERTNQFNAGLTRYTTAQVQKRMESDVSHVITYDVSDRFGSSGVSAAAVVVTTEDALRVEDWWISCRVLGRGVERAVLRHIIGVAQAQGSSEVQVVYRKGPRNLQVEELLEGLATLRGGDDGEHLYSVPVDFDDGDGRWVEVVTDASQ